MSMKIEIKKIAIELAKRHGLINLTRDGVCGVAGIPPGSFVHVMGESFATFVDRLRSEGVSIGTPDHGRRVVSPEIRRTSILTAAVELASEVGYRKITREGVAERAGISMSLVTHHFHTMPQLRRDVVRHAVSHGCVPVVAQALAAKDPHVKKAPSWLVEKAAEYLKG